MARRLPDRPTHNAFLTSAAAAGGGRLDRGGKPFPLEAPPSEDQDQRLTSSVDLPPDLTDHLLASTRTRYELRHSVANFLRPDDPADGRGPAVCGCGHAGHQPGVVNVHLSKKSRAYLSGVYKCDSAWICPVCVFRRAAEIRERVAPALEACIANGGTVVFFTITAGHYLGTRLADIYEGVLGAFRKARQGRIYKVIQLESGLLGSTNTVESPWSPTTGWHCHVHGFFFFEHRNKKRVHKACNELIARYLKTLGRYGLSGVPEAQHFEICYNALKAARYVTKLASEIAYGSTKKSRKGDSVNAFLLAARATMKNARGEPLEVPGLDISPERAKELFREYAAVLPGTHMGVISPQLAGRLGLKSQDEDASEREQQLLIASERIGDVPKTEFNRLHRRNRVAPFLQFVEQTCKPDGSNWAIARKWFDQAASPDPNEMPPPDADGRVEAGSPLDARDPVDDIVCRSRGRVGTVRFIASERRKMIVDHARFPSTPPPPSEADIGLALLAPESAKSNLVLRGLLQKLMRRAAVTNHILTTPASGPVKEQLRSAGTR